ncbi:7 transmembrane receptor [Ancylostoma caninum]|uniref:7 transmembrane receptor n=1 Tax=Ancylostoma caninum TaxID=29170 RepID=A0A368H3E2_ANCCA|nr:7 transmembrane receptor [Ancylostoma caninum]
MNDSDIMDESMVPTTPEICNFEQPPMTNIRFWLVTVFGSTVSSVSIVNNILLFYVFFSKKHHRSSHNVYLMLLAFFDIFVSTAYILLMSVNILIDYLISPTLMQIWYSYMVPMITISHVAMTSSSFLIVCASFERYCLTVNSSFLPFAQRNRKFIAAFAILLGVISKGTMCLEFEFFDIPECEGLITQTQMKYPDFVINTPYNVVWRFWYRNVATVIAPFFILAYFNIRIVKALTKHTKMTVCQLAGNALVEKAKRKATARAATRTLVMVVCCYLISNIISVALTIWEHLDRDTLMEYVNFYAIAIDLVSLLTTSACACRLPIYLTCQPSLRREIREVVNSIACCRKGMVEDSEYLVNTSMTASTRATSATTQDLVYKRCSTGCALVDEPQVITEAVLQPIVLASTEDTKICLSSAYETLL